MHLGKVVINRCLIISGLWMLKTERLSIPWIIRIQILRAEQKKNLLYDEVISLPAGSYILNYSSDDSHSARRWNSMPPNDIQFWGVTIWPATAKDAANVSPFKAPKTLTPLVDLTRVRDDELVSKGVKLEQRT